jgi:hypothetical protein
MTESAATANKHPGPKRFALATTCINVNKRCRPSWTMPVWSPPTMARNVPCALSHAPAHDLHQPPSTRPRSMGRPGAGLEGPSPWRSVALPVAQQRISRRHHHIDNPGSLTSPSWWFSGLARVLPVAPPEWPPVLLATTETPHHQ